MGILYDKVLAHKEMKRNFVLEKLREKGVTHSVDGISIMDLDYEDLKYELVILAFKEIDAERDAQKWF